MSSRLGTAVVRLTAASKQAVHGAGRAGLATTTPARASIKYSPVPKYLQEKQKLFQLPNNMPVHVKGGAIDKVLFYVTGTLCAIGVVECVHVWYMLSYPQTKN